MKILIYTESFFPNMGGLERNTFTLASTLMGMGHTPTILTTTEAQNTEGGYPFQVIRSQAYQTYFSAIRDADLVFINGGMALKISLLAWVLRKKYLIIYQNSHLYLRDNKGLLSLMSTSFRKFMANQAQFNITVSQHAHDVLKGLLSNPNIETLVNPIDAELEAIAVQKSQTPTPKVYDILFAGRIIEGKGIFILIDALKKVQNVLNLNIAFAGKGEHEAHLLKYAAEKQVNIAYLGRLDREELMDIYAQSKVLVVPSSTHIEGNPLVIAEALTLGLPIIASNQPAMIEAVGNAGYTFISGDADDLADKIKLLFNGQWTEKQHNTIIRKKEFSYKQYQTRLNAILQTVITPSV